MSVENLETLLKEVRKDVGLAAMLGADPAQMEKHGLEPREIAALLNQDVDALREMGVDPELARGAHLIGRMTG
ncbi:MAG: hypothetical protein H0T15_02875 [Thermoleophilaceae bacterium]|nr:hypothetical protein [Thermoleophilaceae bacterium]